MKFFTHKTKLLLSIFLLPIYVFAQNNKDQIARIKNPLDKIDSLSELLIAVLMIIRQIGLYFVVLAIMYTGWLYIKAQGNATKISEANKALKWTLIGGFIILTAPQIAAIFANTLKALAGN